MTTGTRPFIERIHLPNRSVINVSEKAQAQMTKAVATHFSYPKPLVQKQDNKEKRKENAAILTLALALKMPYKIYHNPLTLSVHRMRLDIKQGKLYELMVERRDDLERTRIRLKQIKAGRSVISTNKSLIDDYKSITKRLAKGMATAKTIKDIERLTQKDPELAIRISEEYELNAGRTLASENKSISFASEHFEEGAISTPSITSRFN